MKEALSEKYVADGLEPVQPTRPVAPWIGGKRALAGLLIQRIAAVPHVRYVEPFVGMGGVFLRRRHRPKLEVINDIDRDVVNLFRILQRHYQQLLDVLKWQICSRAEFERLPRFGLLSVRDSESGRKRTLLVRPSFQQRLQESFAARRYWLIDFFKRYHAQVLFVEDGFNAERVTQYFYRAGDSVEDLAA